MRPPVPVEVPNDEIIDDIMINLNSELSLDGPMSLPPPPSRPDEDDEEQIFMVVEQDPQLIGGIQGLHSHIRYPDLMRRAGIEGRVFVQFVVNEQGKVVDPKIVRGLHDLADAEVIRVLLEHAEFTPGLQRGRPVKVQYSLQIVFRLEN
jgi:protein TonB